MNYLERFTEYLKQTSTSLDGFSPLVQSHLQKTREEFTDGEVLDIQPVSVQEEREDLPDHTIVRYKGTYIYGFMKNGIFYEEPGNPSTATERKQNEDGYVAFYVNKNTGIVDYIYETFAGNSWGNGKIGKNEEKNSKVGLILFAIVALGYIVVRALLHE